MRLYDFSIPVVLFEKTQTGYDPFGTPVYEENMVIVNHCLVAMNQYDQLTDINTIKSAKASFTIAIPKGDEHHWRNSKVMFTLGGISYECETVGDYLVGIEGLIPLEWHKQIRCVSVR